MINTNTPKKNNNHNNHNNNNSNHNLLFYPSLGNKIKNLIKSHSNRFLLLLWMYLRYILVEISNIMGMSRGIWRVRNRKEERVKIDIGEIAGLGLNRIRIERREKMIREREGADLGLDITGKGK